MADRDQDGDAPGPGEVVTQFVVEAVVGPELVDDVGDVDDRVVPGVVEVVVLPGQAVEAAGVGGQGGQPGGGGAVFVGRGCGGEDADRQHSGQQSAPKTPVSLHG